MPTKKPLWIRPAGKPAPQAPPPPEKPAPPPGEPIPTAQVVVAEAVHRADWPIRAERAYKYDERLEQARQSGEWAGPPVKLRPCGSGYVLVSGFARLAVAVDAELPTVLAVLEPALPEAPLAQIRLPAGDEEGEELDEQELAQRRQLVEQIGALPVGLVVRATGEDEYELVEERGWYELARGMGLEKVGVVIV
ncbi:MAG: hypothetical protein JXA37_03720 [Chloroflexia bacterium]|nr:hypothetical protein [Chloroflexia bacterium]